VDALDVSTVAVVGAGTMGAGIAGEFARAGCDVRLVDLRSDLLQRGMEMLTAAQQALVEADLVSEPEAAAALSRVSTLTSLEGACESVDLLIEAVPEDLALKQSMFERFDRCCPKEALLASNTSGLSITAIARATARPERVAGVHFWNPPHVIPLVEITQGEETAEPTTALLLQVCRQIGKRPILVRHDVPGFVGNRLQFAVLREALHILSQGIASAEDIDAAMSCGPGLRYGLLGPLRTADLGGLDVFAAISKYLFAELCADPHPPDVLTDLVQQGNLGAKTGSGFYAYGAEDLKRILAQRDRVLLEFVKILRREEGRHTDG